MIYASNESGAPEIFIASFPSFAVKRKISSGGGLYPVWAKGGNEIFYRSPEGCDDECPATAAVSRFALGADGTRFLTTEPVDDSDNQRPEITLVLNWAAEMKLT